MLKTPIDRPFRSKEAIESEQALIAQYRELGNPELLADTMMRPARAEPAAL